MKVTFLGADHEVTGSCTLLEVCGKRILIDYGMEQGENIFENAPLPCAPGEIDMVLLTHAHMDHAGMLPYLHKTGFDGVIYATDATIDLCEIMLRDSAHIQESDAEWKNRKAQRAGNPPVEPLYTIADADACMPLFQAVAYNTPTVIAPGVSVRYVDAGHLLGSASIEITMTEDGVTKTLVCSGDIGNTDQPIINDPTYLTQADYVLMESTYGDRSHGTHPELLNSLCTILQRTFDRGGSLIVPCFAVGRTQEMLYLLRKIITGDMLHGHKGFSVYVDSPLANEATHVFTEHVAACADEETRAMLQRGENPIGFVGLRTSISSDDSKAINTDDSCKVILSASGMCDAGRIRHHLKHNLWKPQNTVLFVGYQAYGTLGRALIEGAQTVKLFGEVIDVKAEICSIQGISGHADNEGLMRWASAFTTAPQCTFLNHGDETACDTLTARIQNELHRTAVAPYSGDAWDLLTGEQVAQGNRQRIEKPTVEARKASSAYTGLMAAFNRVKRLIEKCTGYANKDLAKMEAALNAFCDKWE